MLENNDDLARIIVSVNRIYSEVLTSRYRVDVRKWEDSDGGQSMLSVLLFLCVLVLYFCHLV